jgi:Domain of unknown function DUF11
MNRFLNSGVTQRRRSMQLAAASLVVLGAGVGHTVDAHAQERAQADVSISTVTLTPLKLPRGSKQPPSTDAPAAPTNVRCSITVHNENDDDAQHTQLVVVLPVEVSIVANRGGFTLHPATGGFVAYLTLDLGPMRVGQNVSVDFTFTPSKYGNKVGAFAFSESPDPNPANNYRDATL